MAGDTTRPQANYRFDELVIWRTRLPKVKFAVLPPSNNRPNPLVSEDMLYVSIFSPGAISALERKTGKLIWQRALPRFGASAVHLARRTLFAQTANTLYALEPETGKTIWSFCPCGDSGESMYSAPTIHRNSVFIGDRRGYLHCLDFRTGEMRWKLRTNKEVNCDLNSTPVVVKKLVIVATNAKIAAAYDTRTGKRRWVCNLDGPSVFGPLLYRGLLVVVTDSIYLLKPESGKVVRRFSWKRDGVSAAECAQNGVVAILRGNWPPDGTVTLVGLNDRGMQFTETCRSFCAHLHYGREKNLIYVSHLEGIDVRRSDSGRLACTIRQESRRIGEIGLVSVTRDTIYALTNEGHVYGLRHPRCK
jgi:PQQ-like domain